MTVDSGWPRFVYALLLATTVVLLVGCAGSAHRSPMGMGAGGYSGKPVAVDENYRTEVLLTALALLDNRYKYGGSTPDSGFDCSGLVAYVFRAASGTGLPHNTEQIARLSRPISRASLRPGDFVFFNTLNRPYSHMGIYLGDGRFINAPSSGGRVRIDSMSSRYYAGRFDDARTLFRQ